MEITVTINDCTECYHCDTNRYRCLHPTAVEDRPMNSHRYIKEQPIYDANGFVHKLTGTQGRKVRKIPIWCPLKKGDKY